MEASGNTQVGARPAGPTITITATFTAEPIEATLRFWSERLGLDANLEFAAYNQVFQTLLDPGSLARRNRDGVNVVLLRFSDWDHADTHDQRAELVEALRQAATAAPLVVVTPPVDGPRAASEQQRVHALASAIVDLPGVFHLDASAIADRYPVTDTFDNHAESVGHVPYTPDYFAALGTAVMRHIVAIRRAPFKVIALDCDNTLWGGIVGEDGVDGIRLDAGHQALQRFMVAQHDAGKLLCLASKNNAADVDEVFDRRPMVLTREHLVAQCVDWNPKPHNLRRLADELSLGLDSFVFLDDSAVECAQMQDAAPEVLSLQVPERADEFAAFIDHVWAFDQLAVTATDRQRTAMYRENRAREQSRDAAASLADFLARLELVVDIAPLADDELPRASQLTQRTNQFNFTTVRRSEAEVAAFQRDNNKAALRIYVRDRFGDYGFVGLVLLDVHGDAVNIDTFLLSCRALGRGVEHRMMAAVGDWARQRGLSSVRMRWVETAKNAPARAFFDEIAGERAVAGDGERTLTLGASEAAGIEVDTSRAVEAAEMKADVTAKPAATPSRTDRRHEARTWQTIATSLRTVPQIVAAMQAASKRRRDDALGVVQAPESDLEQTVAELWTDQLGLDRVGRSDAFLALGGNSLAATRIISRIRATYEVELSLVRFFETPTVAGVAAAIEDLILAELEAD